MTEAPWWCRVFGHDWSLATSLWRDDESMVRVGEVYVCDHCLVVKHVRWLEVVRTEPETGGEGA